MNACEDIKSLQRLKIYNRGPDEEHRWIDTKKLSNHENF